MLSTAKKALPPTQKYPGVIRFNPEYWPNPAITLLLFKRAAKRYGADYLADHIYTMPQMETA